MDIKNKCEKCNGSGWHKAGVRRENGIEVPYSTPCECQKNEPNTFSETSDFIGRVVLDSPEKFRG